MLWPCMCVCVENVPGGGRERKQRETQRQEGEKKLLKRERISRREKKITFEIILSSFSLQFPHFLNTGFIPLAHYET